MITTERAAIYVRVSTEEQAKEGYSIDAQVNTLKLYAQLYKMEVVEVYKDEGKSGKNINRPELQRLLKDAEEKKYDMLLIWKISRLSRNLKYLLQIVDKLDSLGISFISQSETFNTSTSVGRMTLQILGSIAEFERNSIIENIKLALKEKGDRGEWLGGKVFGYKNIKKELIPDKYQSKVVKQIFEMYNDDVSISNILRSLKEKGILTVRGNNFTSNGIYRILKNPVYIGSFNKPNGNIIKGNHQAIIDYKLFYKVQKKILNNRTCTDIRRENILTGHLKCPVCNGGMVKYATSKYRYYRCGNYHNYGKSKCKGFIINSYIIEKQVLSALQSKLSNHDYKKILYDEFKISDVFNNEYNFELINFPDERKKLFVDYFIDIIYLNIDKTISKIEFCNLI